MGEVLLPTRSLCPLCSLCSLCSLCPLPTRAHSTHSTHFTHSAHFTHPLTPLTPLTPLAPLTPLTSPTHSPHSLHPLHSLKVLLPIAGLREHSEVDAWYELQSPQHQKQAVTYPNPSPSPKPKPKPDPKPNPNPDPNPNPKQAVSGSLRLRATLVDLRGDPTHSPPPALIGVDEARRLAQNRSTQARGLLAEARTDLTREEQAVARLESFYVKIRQEVQVAATESLTL